MNILYYIRKAQDVRMKDYLSAFPMIAGLLISLFTKRKYQSTWGICERFDEAQDNGYHFYQYLCEEHPEIDAVYVIDKKCQDYSKVSKLGKTAQYGSIKHWVLYFSSKYLISSQSFKPNGYMATLIERLKLFKPQHVFLQHGITINKPEYLLASHRPVKFFIAGADPEYAFLSNEFGYEDGTVQYTGFARFDALHNCDTIHNRILIMPTWRKWLWQKSEVYDDGDKDIASSEYVSSWKEVLTDERFMQMIDTYHLDVIFVPHPNLKKIFPIDSIVNPKITIADSSDDLQYLLKTSQLLITDYSSVFFDMVYMKKPVVFFQFDEEKYRQHHYKEGWFDYHNSPFGTTCKTANEVVDAVNKNLLTNYIVDEAYELEHRRVFKLYDQNNCERIYNLLIKNQ